jgi:predicted ATPase
VLLVDGDGLTETRWDDLPLVAHWRAFLDDPQRYLRHL